MKEILAENLQPLFDNTLLTGKRTYKGKLYEVWEVSDLVYQKMCDMTEEEFRNTCPESMWRGSDGSIFGHPYEKNIVNGHKMISWSKGFFYCEESRKSRKYESLLSYLCNVVGASTPKNVCACAMDLAKANNMTMGELFVKYEGE